jgi:predicted anti-sigma-YlaC factor YlaD
MDNTTTCSEIHDFISANLDGELTESESVALSVHLDGCVDCRNLELSLLTQHRLVRVAAVDAIPDLAPRVLSIAHPPRLGRRGWVRQALAVIGLTELIVALPALILGEDSGIPIHVARHIGSLGAALGFALLYVAWKPTRAYGLLPFVASLAAFMSISSILDLSFGRASLATESTHLVEFAGMFFVWLLAGSPRPQIPRFSRLVHRFG